MKCGKRPQTAHFRFPRERFPLPARSLKWPLARHTFCNLFLSVYNIFPNRSQKLAMTTKFDRNYEANLMLVRYETDLCRLASLTIPLRAGWLKYPPVRLPFR